MTIDTAVAASTVVVVVVWISNTRLNWFGYKRLIGIHFIILVVDQFETRNKHYEKEREKQRENNLNISLAAMNHLNYIILYFYYIRIFHFRW